MSKQNQRVKPSEADREVARARERARWIAKLGLPPDSSADDIRVARKAAEKKAIDDQREVRAAERAEAQAAELRPVWEAHAGKMTWEELKEARSPAAKAAGTNSWTAAQLREWGVPWPPPKGWIPELIKPSELAAFQVDAVWKCPAGHPRKKPDLYWLARPIREGDNLSLMNDGSPLKGPDGGLLKSVPFCRSCDQALLNQAILEGNGSVTMEDIVNRNRREIGAVVPSARRTWQGK